MRKEELKTLKKDIIERNLYGNRKTHEIIDVYFQFMREEIYTKFSLSQLELIVQALIVAGVETEKRKHFLELQNNIVYNVDTDKIIEFSPEGETAELSEEDIKHRACYSLYRMYKTWKLDD